MTRRAFLMTMAIGLLATALCGCRETPPSATTPPAGAMTPPAGAIPQVTVRVGYFPNVTHAPAVLGFSAGAQTFARALNGQARLETKTFNAGPAEMEALHARALDLAFVGPTPAINAYARGGDLVLVANVANGGSVLVARKGSGIKTLRDVAGKRIAVPQIGNTQDAILRHLLAEAKIRLKDRGGDTTVLPVENPDVSGLFQRGELDAACVPEPWGSRLELEAGATVVLDWKAIWRDGKYPVTVLVVRKEFLQQHLEAVRAFVGALQQVTQGLARAPQAQATALNAELKVLTGKQLQPEVITRALKRVEFTTVIDRSSLQAMAEVMKQVGYAKTVPNLDGMLDESLLAPPAGR